MTQPARTPRIERLLGEFTRDEFVDMLVRSGAGREWAEKQADARYGSRESIEAKELDADAIESAHVKEGDRTVIALGGKVVVLSQYRASKLTAGIPDRRYYFPRIRWSFWWEAKPEWGVQSEAQKDFQAMCERCGETYVLGDISVLRGVFLTLGICTLNPDGSLEPVHQPEA